MGSWNTRVGRNLMHFGAVGWQPTALKSNHGVLKHQAWRELDAFWGCRLATYTMVAFKCCRLPTYSPKMPINASSSLQTLVFQDPWLLLSAVGCQPTAPKCLKFPPNSRVSRPWLLLSAVGCQPTAPKCIKYPPTLVFQNPMVAFKCCSCQPTAPKCLKYPPNPPPNPRVSRPWLLLSAVGCQPTVPKCLKYPPTLVFQDHGCF